MNRNERHFGNKLRELREQRHKLQVEVVQDIKRLYPEIRMSQTTLSTLEQRDSAPREDVLEVLCDYYDVPIAYFFDSEESDHARDIDVDEYIEALRFHSPASKERFAHSRGKRYPGDEIEQRLSSGSLSIEDLDYLDT